MKPKSRSGRHWIKIRIIRKSQGDFLTQKNPRWLLANGLEFSARKYNDGEDKRTIKDCLPAFEDSEPWVSLDLIDATIL